MQKYKSFILLTVLFGLIIILGIAKDVNYFVSLQKITVDRTQFVDNAVLWHHDYRFMNSDIGIIISSHEYETCVDGEELSYAFNERIDHRIRSIIPRYILQFILFLIFLLQVLETRNIIKSDIKDDQNDKQN